MNENKAKRLIVASTVGAVLLAVILLVIMIYQLIAIGVKNKRIDYYNEQIAMYDKMIEEGQDVYEARSQRWWIIQEARELGYIFENDRVK